MNKSLFKVWLDKFNFKSVVKKIVEKINGKKEAPIYYHKQMLKKEYSPTLRWDSLNSNGTIVAADIVSLDSSLPLKRRDRISQAEGVLPKLGMKLYLSEQAMRDLRLLQQLGNKVSQIFSKIFKDSDRCIKGVYEQMELMFLQALSTGVAQYDDEKRPGTAIRVNYGHPDANKFGVSTKWSDEKSNPIKDIEEVLSRANDKGDSPKYILMDKASWNIFKSSQDVKELFAFSQGFVGDNLPRPTLKQANEAMQENYGLTIVVIDRTIITESNGVRTPVKPFATNTVIFLNSLEVGTLTYGDLEEEFHQAKQVDYAKADDYILISKYHKVDPIREFTSSQAVALPVINNIDSIYIMDTEDATIDDQTEGDANFTYEKTNYTKQSVVDAINKANGDLKALITNADTTLQNKINKLSDEEIKVFEASIVAV